MRTPRVLPLLLLSLGSLALDVCALSDPTRPSGFVTPVDSGQQAVTLRLESVLIGASRRVAVINGKTCAVGDRVDGATVVAINADAAVLVRNGTRITLPLLKVKVRNHGQ